MCSSDLGVLYYYTSGADRIVGTTVLQSNTWYHVAVVRNSGTTHLYVNGTSEGSFSDTLDYASTPTFRIGQRYDGTPYNYDGYISNFRLINGTALYTANFTPPAQRLENISGRGREYRERNEEVETRGEVVVFFEEFERRG